jgi:hypothetical protein
MDSLVLRRYPPVAFKPRERQGTRRYCSVLCYYIHHEVAMPMAPTAYSALWYPCASHPLQSVAFETP